MDHHYYGLKALIVVVGIGIAILSSAFGLPKLSGSMTHTHYSAAASVEMAIAKSSARVSRALVGFVREHDCAKLVSP